MIRILLIRHGESAMNQRADLIGGFSPHTPLTDRGIAQATALGAHLASTRIVPDEVHVSPAVRTRETERLVRAAMGHARDPREDLRLAELGQGIWEGRSRRECYSADTLARIAREQMDFKLEGGESMRGVGARMRAWCDDVVTDPAPRTIFAFGHGMAIRCLVATLFDWSHQRTYETVTANTSITTLAYATGWTLAGVGETPHAPGA